MFLQVTMLYAKRQFPKSVRQSVPLRLLLIAPFLLQIFAAVGLVSYFSFRNGQRAVNDLANQLIDKASQQVDEHLDTYLALPQQLNQINADAIAFGWLDTNNSRTSEQYFWSQAKAFEDLGYIGFALPDGRESGAGRWINGRDLLVYDNPAGKEILASDYLADAEGGRAKLLQSYETDPISQAPSQEAIRTRQPIWSDISIFETGTIEVTAAGEALSQNTSSSNIGLEYYVALPARYAIFNEDNSLAGVLMVDMLLTSLSDFLHELDVSPSGQVFIMERSGLLIGSSSEQPIIRNVAGQTQRYSALDSPDPIIRAVAEQLKQQFSDFNAIQNTQELKIRFNGEQQFVQVMSWQDEHGLDWLMVVIVPESDFMAQINANTRTTILLCLAALVGAALLGVYTSQWITQPILRLSRAADDLATAAQTGFMTDQDTHSVQPSKVKELGVLAYAFNRMAQQLRESFTALEKTNEQLEHRVEERTAELRVAKEEAESAQVAADVANQAKSEFLANMSHELRTPLNGILGYAQVLQRSGELTEKALKGVDIIHQCGSHLLTLINDVLDISKIEAHKLELTPTKFHLPSFLQGVAEICRIKADQKKIEFHYQPNHQLPTGVYADEKRLRQVLINLIGNAIKFTDVGEVLFKVELLDEQAEIANQNDEDASTSDLQSLHNIRFTVKDTGVGMAPEQLQKIFLPFEQVGNVNKQSEGTGLGLMISQKIVGLMGSNLAVESAPEVGSVFWFDVKIAEAKDWATSVRGSQRGTIVGYQGPLRQVLVVDDRWENRSILVSLLKPLGFGVVEAVNGQDGLDQAIDCPPDLIVTDLAMPIMDGFELLKHLRQSNQLKHVPVIVSSASVFEIDQYKSLNAGANAFLPKPVQAETLLDLLKTYLHLEWVYAARPSTEMQPNLVRSGKASSTDSLLPSTADLEILHDLAMQGLLHELVEQCDRIDTVNPEVMPFTQTLRQLAKGFQLKQIQTVLEQHLEHQS